MEINIDEDNELLEMLGLIDDEDDDLKNEEEITISKYDFNKLVMSDIIDGEDEDILSILYEIKSKLKIDDETFSLLLDDTAKQLIHDKLTNVRLVGNIENIRINNPIEI